MTEENPFQPPEYAYPAMPPVPGQDRPAHWFTPTVRIVMALCVIVAAGLGVLTALGISHAAPSGAPGTGDCLYLTPAGVGQTYHRVSCTDDKAMYKVDDWMVGSDSCGSGDYVRYQISGDSSRSLRTLCLALNVRSGECLRDVDDDAKISKVSCGDATAQARVYVIDEPGAQDRCDGADLTFSYSGPPGRTVCLLATGEHI